jgi:hypothetical protein
VYITNHVGFAVISTYSHCMFMYLHHANWHSSATLAEVSPCFFLSCKANARVKPAKMGHSLHSSKTFGVVLCTVCFVSFCVLFVLCRSVYCLFCVVLCIVCFVSFCVLFVLCRSVYCLFCVVLCIVCVCV